MAGVVIVPPLAMAMGNADFPEDSVGLPDKHRWAVLYDADCGFCRWLLAGLLRWDRAVRLRPIAVQRPEADDLLADLTPAERMASWHLISSTGALRSGGAAVPPLLRLLPGGRLPAAAFAQFPRLTDGGYRWVAEHRSQLSKWVPTRSKQHASERVRQREQALETHARPAARVSHPIRGRCLHAESKQPRRNHGQ